MKQAVKTSELLKYRIQKSVPERTKEIIQIKVLTNLPKLRCQTVTNFHAICLDTYPPCVYLNQVSHGILSFVHDYNEATGQIKVSYTLDAGPNAFLFIQQNYLSLFMSELVNFFPTVKPNSSYLRGIVSTLPNNAKPYGFKSKVKDLLKYIMFTKLESGPKCVDDHLLNSDGTLKSKIESIN